jgi:histidine triad (HIT) family protein
VEQLKKQNKNLKIYKKMPTKEELLKSCIFCVIANKLIESKILYEDEQVMAFMDINPASSGHILLIPKEHYSVFPQMPQELKQHFFKVIQKITIGLKKFYAINDVTIMNANGYAAGQKSAHLSVHIIPVYNKPIIEAQITSFDNELVTKAATTLKTNIQNMLKK